MTSFDGCGECYEQSRKEETLFSTNLTDSDTVCGQMGIFLYFNVSVFKRKNLEGWDCQNTEDSFSQINLNSVSRDARHLSKHRKPRHNVRSNHIV